MASSCQLEAWVPEEPTTSLGSCGQLEKRAGSRTQTPDPSTWPRPLSQAQAPPAGSRGGWGKGTVQFCSFVCFFICLFPGNLQRDVCGIGEDPRSGGRGSLRARAQRLQPQPKSALGAQDQLRLPARLWLCVVGQDAEAQQRECQDHLHLGHGEDLPDAVPVGGREYGTVPGTWPWIPIPAHRGREGG